MWHDNETRQDFIGFMRFSDTVADLATDQGMLPVTIGLFGDWGSGKSSALCMLEDRLKEKEKEGVLVLRFNGWLFEGYDDTKAALMTTILDFIEERIKTNESLWKKVNTKADALRKRVNWLRVMGLAAKGVLALTSPAGAAIVGVQALNEGLDFVKEKAKDPEAVAKELSGYVKGAVPEEEVVYKNVRDFREDFSEFIKESGISTLVVLIDDLDRCLPESIVATLEAIKLFLSVPQTAFVIAADERLVKHAIAIRYPIQQEGDFDLSQEYLDKMVQVPCILPPMNEIETETYMYLLFAGQLLGKEVFEKLNEVVCQNRKNPKLAQPLNYGIAKSCLGEVAGKLEREFALVERISPPLSRNLNGNPRFIKRFLNTFMLRVRLAKVVGMSLDPAVLAKLMVLERSHIDQFNQLHKWQLAQGGIPNEIAKLEAAVKDKKTAEGLKDSGLLLWLDDPDLVAWLSMDPSIASIDLSPYFHLARESLKMKSEGGRRLSQQQQEVLNGLKSSSQSMRQKAAKTLIQIPDSEIFAIADALIAHLRSWPADTNSTDGLFEAAYAHEGIARRVLEMFKNMSPAGISPRSVPKLAQLYQKHPSLEQEIVTQIEVWAQGTEGLVAKAARAVLEASKGKTQ